MAAKSHEIGILWIRKVLTDDQFEAVCGMVAFRLHGAAKSILSRADKLKSVGMLDAAEALYLMAPQAAEISNFMALKIESPHRSAVWFHGAVLLYRIFGAGDEQVAAFRVAAELGSLPAGRKFHSLAMEVACLVRADPEIAARRYRWSGGAAGLATTMRDIAEETLHKCLRNDRSSESFDLPNLTIRNHIEVVPAITG